MTKVPAAFILSCEESSLTRSKDTPLVLRNVLDDHYDNSRLPDDGEIYRKIQHYQNQRHIPRDEASFLEASCWANLSPNKRRCLKRLLKNGNLTRAFNNLLCFPGLWPVKWLGVVHKILALHCDSVRFQSFLFVKTGLI